MRVSTPRELGLLVKEQRTVNNVSQQQLATAAGVSRKWLSELEQGKTTAEVALVFKVLGALQLNVDIGRVDNRAGIDLDDVLGEH